MTSKWRPSQNCLYVIPDIHGNLENINLIFDRILPLRKNKNSYDEIVFLGDYIDRHSDSHKVLDRLIELKKSFPEQVTFLRGNHEDMFLKAANKIKNETCTNDFSESNFNMLVANGGIKTILGYIERNGKDLSALSWGRKEIFSLVPKEHFDFLNKTKFYYETENFIFVHGGCDPFEPLREQDKYDFLWNRDLIRQVKEAASRGIDLNWPKKIITGHNSSDEPFVYQDFYMLDARAPLRQFVLELHSEESFFAISENQRLVRYDLEERKKRIMNGY